MKIENYDKAGELVRKIRQLEDDLCILSSVDGVAIHGMGSHINVYPNDHRFRVESETFLSSIKEIVRFRIDSLTKELETL